MRRHEFAIQRDDARAGVLAVLLANALYEPRTWEAEDFFPSLRNAQPVEQSVTEQRTILKSLASLFGGQVTRDE